MIDLIYIIYLIGVLTSLECIFRGFLMLSFFTVFTLTLCSTFPLDDGKIRNAIKSFMHRTIKPFMYSVIIAISGIVLIPSERSMYIMTGLYAGDKVFNNITQSETFKKAEQLLNNKLDELLESSKKETDK